jgi:uncharacterized protein YjbI with pentapeptide repeats
MTISSQTGRQGYAGNGVTPNFPVPFKFYSNSDVLVIRQSALGIDTLLTEGVNYTITGAGSESGGEIVITPIPAVGESVSVILDPALLQETDYISNDPFPAETHERALDRLTQMMIRTRDLVARTFRVPDGDQTTLDVLPGAAERANTYLTFDNNGDPEFATALPSGTLSQSVIGGLLHPQTAAEVTASVTPTNRAYPPGDVRRYGAVADGTTNDAGAIQASLNAGYYAYLPGVSTTYAIASTLRFKFAGQMIFGDGFGDVNASGNFLPRTTLKWIGAAGGKMISVSNGTDSNLSDCTIQDVLLDGNALANIGVEGYDESYGGGSWRTRLTRVGIVRITSGINATCVKLGTTAFPGFAHDTQFDGCFFYGAALGVWGAGAKYSFTHTTIGGMTDCGCRGESGSAWTFGPGTIFSQNNRDFDGANIQQADFHGVWFEDSAVGIYRGDTAQNVSFHGCYLHTKVTNTTRLMDMGNAAGNFSLINCYVPAGTGSTLVKNINPDAEYSIIGSNVTIDTGYKIRAQGTIFSDNEAFACGITSDASNVTGDGTVYSLNAVAHTEEYDLAGKLNAATGIYTGGLHGRRTFAGQITLGGVASGHTDALLELVTTQQAYNVARVNPGAVMNASNEVTLSFQRTVSFAASDTAYLRLMVSGSTKVVDVLSGGVATKWRSRFEGRIG